MARFEFRMPDIGEGLADVEVAKWLVRVGDQVEENEPIAEVETDKAFVSMPAPATGRIVELVVAEGERVKIGAPLLVMETSEEATSPAPGAREEETAAQAPPATERGEGGGDKVTASARPGQRIQASPVARKRALDLGITLEEVTGSGPRGRITVEDVERHARDRQAQTAPAVETPAADLVAVERIPVRGLRRRIAEAMTQSYRTIPHVVGFHEFDAQALSSEREYLKSHAVAAGVRLGYLPFIIRATVEALKKHPYLNASFDADEGVILLKKAYNVGIAVATDEGLVVPVIAGADQFDLFGLAGQIERLVAAARERRLTPQDMQHGTFTITNVGSTGGWFGTSIIRYPEAAILGVGKIEDRAVVRNGQIVARPVLPISLTFDHRVLDGAEALTFITTLRHSLEDDPRSLSPR